MQSWISWTCRNRGRHLCHTWCYIFILWSVLWKTHSWLSLCESGVSWNQQVAPTVPTGPRYSRLNILVLKWGIKIRFRYWPKVYLQLSGWSSDYIYVCFLGCKMSADRTSTKHFIVIWGFTSQYNPPYSLSFFPELRHKPPKNYVCTIITQHN